MITAKTLSGEYVTLEATNEKEFDFSFKEKYIKKKFRPFVTVNLLNYKDEHDENDEKDENVILVNTHKIIPLMETDKINWSYLSENQHPEAFKMCVDYLNSNDDGYIYNQISYNILSSSNDIAVEYILEKYKNKEIEYNAILKLAQNNNTKVLELLFQFEEQFKNDSEVWYELAGNSNPYVFQKFLNKMKEDEKFRKNFSFSELCLCFNKESIEWLLKNPSYIDYTLLSRNPYAIDHLIENKKYIDWKYLSLNPHPKAINLLRNIKTKINLENLALNKSEDAIELLKEIMNCKANFLRLSKNKKEMIYKNLHLNPYAIDIILDYYKDNSYKDKLPVLWLNPSIFYPYDNEDIYNTLQME